MMHNRKLSGSSMPKLGQTQFDSIFYQLLHKLDQQEQSQWTERRSSLAAELRSIEFWRAIIAECLATFFYVFLVCAVHISWTGSLIAHQPNWLVMSFTSGLTMATLCQCFGHISGAHVNPAVSIALLSTRKISVLRAVFYIIAQCGGSIAGSALLYGVSIPAHQEGALGVSLPHEILSTWQILSVEFVLSFLIVFTVFATCDPSRKSLGSDSLSIGIAYLVASLAGLPSSGASLNPARALGPSFVMGKWSNLHVYWIGPCLGGILAALIYEFIFDTKKMSRSVRDAFDQIEKESQKDHYDEPTELKLNNKSILAYSNSQHSSASSSGSSGPSQHTGYSSVQSASGFNPSSLANSTLNNTFQHTVLTHDPSIYPQATSSANHLNNNLSNNLNLTSGQLSLNNSHNGPNVGIYSTTSRLNNNLRTLAYGNNLKY